MKFLNRRGGSRRATGPGRSDLDSPGGAGAVASPGGLEIKVIDDAMLAGDPQRWRRLFDAVLVAEGVTGPGEATLVFVDAVAISQLNRLHMGHDGPTDVLSFPIDGGGALMPGEIRVVGDVVVCPEVAAVNAAGHAGSPDDEMALLICHGVLHLLGYDHASLDGQRAMWARERAILAAAWPPFDRDPWEDAS